MKTVQSDIGHAAEIHKLYLEFLEDVKLGEAPKPEMWFYRYRDPEFFCLYMKHGKKPVGFVLGKMMPYFNAPKVQVEGFFVRRGFREIKFVRGLALALKQHLEHNKVKGLIRFLPRERALRRKNLKPHSLVVEG